VTISLLYRRNDGTFVADIGGIPYHVTPTDEAYWGDAVAEAERLGDSLPYEPEPPEPEPHVPTLTRRQLRLGLLQAGITTAQVEAAIEAIPDPMAREVARIEWADATTYERDHPLVDQIGAALDLAPEQIDAMWLAAAAL